MSAKASKARVLYKTILKLHRGLPHELRKFGDEYVREEFKRHKDAEVQFLPIFYREWTKYANVLSRQLGSSVTNDKLGLGLTESELSKLTEEQVGQLYELYQETQRANIPEIPDDSSNKDKLN